MSLHLTIARKDLLLLWRDKAGLFWVLVFPLLQGLFFGAIFSGEGGAAARMRVAVIDEAGDDGSRGFVDRLRKSEAIEVLTTQRAGRPDARPWTRDAARESVRLGNLVAFVTVQKPDAGASTFGVELPKLAVGIDPVRRAEAGYLQGILAEASFKGIADTWADPAKMRPQMQKAMRDIDTDSDMSPATRATFKLFFGAMDNFLGNIDPKAYQAGGPAALGSLKLDTIDVAERTDRPHSSFEITFPSAVLWGVLGCTAGFAISLVIERRNGTLLRLRVAPISRTDLLAGKALACAMACLASSLLILMIGRFVLGIRIEQPLLLAPALLCTAACFVGITMLISTLGKTENAVAGAGWASLLIMAMLGGGMVPLIAMPQWLLRVSDFSPVKWGIYALEGAIWRQFSIAEMAMPCGILLAIGATCFAIGAFRLSRVEA